MLNVETNRRFNFDTTETLTESEKLEIERQKERCLQVEFKTDLKIDEVGQIFNHYGDIQVVKQAPCIYWIDFED